MPLVVPQKPKTHAFNSNAFNVTWESIELTRENIRGKLIGHRIKYWNTTQEEEDAVYYLSRTTRNWDLIVGLQPDTYYFVKVMAYNAAGEGSESERTEERVKITSFNDRFNQRKNSTQNFTQEEKRAHHNALERKRRDHIKESFTNLRKAVPSLKGEKASRAEILKKTTDCIQNMRRKIQANQKDGNDLKHQIAILEEEVDQADAITTSMPSESPIRNIFHY
ncbi:upstream stimulatory factor 1-like [Glossina fuscipes]|uniref:Upstream stimulatory factor 1-like n=1 Tax=Glossina fuscipes TaxID=7396 RepID=A0A9C5ZK16_9MUSC|nr:upstream stimulatory factor 1-like [Glossina fuscipes]XP_037897719.1 upstream stimulatory factor 1-like [Glossina fuscipes]XP_037897720.1 upstream stimulatory factor 1-like [Glossina fuscipes]